MMNYDDPNRPQRVAALRPQQRVMSNRTGNAAVDGYTLVARKPRGRFYDAPMDPEAADRMEGLFDGINDYD